MAGDITLRLRINADGSAAITAVDDVKKSVDGLGPAGQQAGRSAASGLQQIAPAAQQSAAAAQQVSAALSTSAQAAAGLSAQAASATASLGGFGQSATAQIRLLGELDERLAGNVTTTEQLADTEALLDRAIGAGLLSAEEQADALDTLNKQEQQLTKSLGKRKSEVKENASALDRLTLSNTTAQQSIVTLARSLATGNFKQATSSLISLSSSTGVTRLAMGALTVGVGAAVAAVGGLAVAALAGSRESAALRRAVIATGGAAGVTAGQIEAMVSELDDANGRVGDNRQAMLELVNTSQFAGDSLRDAGSAAVALAELTGRSVSDAARQIAGLATEPSRAVAELNQQYNFLTNAVFSQIRALEEQGRTQDAVRLATSTFADVANTRLREVDGSLGIIDRSLNAVSRGWDSFWDAAKGIGRADDVKDELARLDSLIDNSLRRIEDFQNLAPDDNSLNATLLRLGNPAQHERINGLIAQRLKLQGDVNKAEKDGADEAEKGRITNAANAAEVAVSKRAKGLTEASRRQSELNTLTQEFNALLTAGKDEIAGIPIGDLFADLRADVIKRFSAESQQALEALREETERASDASTAYNESILDLAAELDGPTAEINRRYSVQIAELQKQIDLNKLSVDAATVAQDALTRARDRDIAAIARQVAPIDQMLVDLQFEGTLIGLTNIQRDAEIARRQAILLLQQQGIDATSKEGRAKLALVDAAVAENAARQQIADTSQQIADAAAQAAEDYQRAWQGATDAALRSLGEFAARGAQSFEDLGQQLKDIARSFLADLVAMFFRNQLTLRVAGGAGSLLSAGNALASSGGGSSGVPGLGSAGSLLNNPALIAALSTISGALSGARGGSGGISTAGSTLAGAGLGFAAGTTLIGGALGFGAAGAGGALAGAAGAAAALPPLAIGLAAAAIIDKITGGGLFGTKFKTTGAGRDITIGDGGATGFEFVDQKRKKALFGGTKRRTLQNELDSDTQDAIDAIFASVRQAAEAASQALKIEAPQLISGSFRQEFDKKGNLKREFSTIAGKVVEESQAAFTQRLQAVNIVAAIDSALGGTEAQTISEQFAGNAEKLLAGAQFLLAASVDLNNGFGLLGDGGTLTQITSLVQDVAKAGEPLLETYARLVASTDLLTQALTLQNQSLDLGREQFVRFAADIVDAAGGLDKATSLWQGYFSRFFSDNERAATALTAAQQAAQTQFGDIGLDSASFATAEGLAQFRVLFEQALPTLSADAVVQWLEAAQAIGVVIDAQETLNQTLADTTQAIDEAAQAMADQLAAMLDNVRSQAQDAADALADFGLSELASGLAQVSRETERAIAKAITLGATESDLAEIRALGAARTELLQRQAQADLAELLADVSQSLFEIDASPLEAELSRIALAMQDTLAQAAALGAGEADLARIRALGAQQSAQVVEAEVDRLREVFAQLAGAIADARSSISDDILNIRRTQTGFSEAGFQAGQIASLRDQLAGAVDPQQQVGLIDQIRQATVARYNAEIADIQHTAQLQEQAAQQAQQAVEAQRQALARLRDFADGLGLSSNSPLTAFQRLDVARAQFDAQLGRARSGDVEAISGLQQAAEALLTENRAVFGVSRTAVAEFERVQAAVRGIAGQGVRGAASFADPFQRASIDVNSRIATLQAQAISELQGLDDTLAALNVMQEASTEGTIQALRDRFDQAATHTQVLVGHIQPIFDVLNRQSNTGNAQVAQLQVQTAQLAQITAELQNGADISAAFLDKFLVYAQQQGTTMEALVERLGRAIERSSAAGVRA